MSPRGQNPSPGHWHDTSWLRRLLSVDLDLSRTQLSLPTAACEKKVVLESPETLRVLEDAVRNPGGFPRG